MRGPVAPKDPERKRPFFYIMKDKEAYAALNMEGKPVHYIYEDSGRLISSAEIVGNIKDEQMLDLLKSTEGFRRLVHSIGITAETENPKEEIGFVFQMYGKQDPLGGGTNLKVLLHGDGMEQRIVLEECTWSEDDKEPGQIRFEFTTPDIMANVSVRFYLNDGYVAPEPEQEEAVDTQSAEYQAMIRRSLMQLGDPTRLQRAINRAKSGQEVTLAFIGGSITQGAGATPINTECYAYKTWEKFRETFGDNGTENIRLIKAGVGGTPSELGMLRFDRDVLREKEQPDVVVIEFAVNDEGDETAGVCYESLVRKVLDLPNHPAVILLFSVFANDWNLQDRLGCVGERYELPMVSILDAVTPQFAKKPGEGRVLSKNQFFYDMFHPTNLGHTIMADSLLWLCRETEHAAAPKRRTPEPAFDVMPAIGADFENVKLFDRKERYEGAEIDCGDFSATDTELQSVEMDVSLELTPEFPNNWMYDGTKRERPYFEMTIKARSVLLIFKDSGSVDAAKVKVYVDGEMVYLADPRVNGWLHCNPKIIVQGNECQNYHIRIEIDEGDLDKKFTILGFGYVK